MWFTKLKKEVLWNFKNSAILDNYSKKSWLASTITAVIVESNEQKIGQF